jgi:hypothetical protein
LQLTALFSNNNNIHFFITIPPAANVRTKDLVVTTLWVLVQLLDSTIKALHVMVRFTDNADGPRLEVSSRALIYVAKNFSLSFSL